MLKRILINKSSAFIAILILILVLMPCTSDKAHPSVDGGISITSQKMTVRNQENLIIFEGKVMVTHANAGGKENLIINADQLKVFFVSSPQGMLSSTEEPGSNKNGKSDKKTQVKEVSSMEAVGNVTMRQGARHGRAEKAIYYEKDDMIILIGNAEIWENDYNVSGKRMTIYLKEERSVVEESKVRINSSK